MYGCVCGRVSVIVRAGVELCACIFVGGWLWVCVFVGCVCRVVDVVVGVDVCVGV